MTYHMTLNIPKYLVDQNIQQPVKKCKSIWGHCDCNHARSRRCLSKQAFWPITLSVPPFHTHSVFVSARSNSTTNGYRQRPGECPASLTCRNTAGPPKPVKLIDPNISEAAGRKLPSNTSDPLDTSATCGVAVVKASKWFGDPVARWVFDQLLSLCGNLQGNFLLKERVLSTWFVFFKVGISIISYLSKFLPVTSQCSYQLGGLETASNCFKVKHAGFPQHKDTVAEPRRTAPWSCHEVKERLLTKPSCLAKWLRYIIIAHYVMSVYVHIQLYIYIVYIEK